MIERNFIFFPEKSITETPSDFAIDFEDVYFIAKDGVKLHGWFISGESNTTWIWFHGNAGNISHRLENLSLIREYLGVNIFIFDYRGYGWSEGKVSEEGTYRDADAALVHILSRQDVDPAKIVLFGRSMGCAVAVDLAYRNNVYALIIESPFTSISDMVRKTVPLLPIGAFIRTKYDSLSKIRAVTCPVLVIHGDQDEVVPIEFGCRLYQAANEPKEFYTISGSGHNDTYVVGGVGYFSALSEFLGKLNKPIP